VSVIFTTSWLNTDKEHLVLVVPAAFSAAVDRLRERSLAKHAGYLTVRLDLPHKPRTTGEHSQNHCLNGFAQQIAESTGNEFDDVKLAGKRRAFRRGLPFLQRDDGSTVLSLVDGEPLPISERDMSVEQAGWVIDELVQLAAELGITLEEA